MTCLSECHLGSRSARKVIARDSVCWSEASRCILGVSPCAGLFTFPSLRLRGMRGLRRCNRPDSKDGLCFELLHGAGSERALRPLWGLRSCVGMRSDKGASVARRQFLLGEFPHFVWVCDL